MHLAGILWIVLCLGYILVMVLREAGFEWWIIFSLSGHSALLIFLLLSLYLFAVFRQVRPGQQAAVEHTLTSTSYYEFFYILTPFLGGLAGFVGLTGLGTAGERILGVSLGTLAATFMVWVVVDPVASIVETLVVPSSREHRRERLAQAKALKRMRQERRQRLLSDILVHEQQQRLRWQQILRPHAERLAELLIAGQVEPERAECEAVEIGVKAWQIGGLSCMRQLRGMALEICRDKAGSAAVIDYTTCWWDGIGNWHCPDLTEQNLSILVS